MSEPTPTQTTEPAATGSKPSFAEQVAAIEAMKDAEAPKPITTEPPAEVAVQDDKPPVEPPKVGAKSRDLDAALRRERKLTQSADQLKAERAAFEAEKQATAKKLAAFDSFSARVLKDPSGAFRDIGIEKGHVDIATGLYVAEAGESAPKELQDKRLEAAVQRMQTAYDAKIQALEDRLAQRETSEKTEKQQTQALDFIQGQLASVPETLPHVRALFESNPRDAASRIHTLATQLRDAGELDDTVTVAGLAERIEQDIAERLKPFAKIYAKTTATPAEKIPPAPRTLTGSHQTTTPPRDRPMTKQERLDESIRAIERGDHLK